jgi:hypothetical protein
MRPKENVSIIVHMTAKAVASNQYEELVDISKDAGVEHKYVV